MTNVEFTSDVVRSATFREKLKGYNPEDVHAFMERSAAAIDQLTVRLSEASARALKAEAALASNSEADESVRRTLVLAQRTAEMAVREANEEAAAIRFDAHRDADHVLQQAQAEAAQLRAEAESAAEAMTSEAHRVHADADAHATATVTDADTYKERVRADADSHAATTVAEADAYAERVRADATAQATATIADAESRAAATLSDAEAHASARLTAADARAADVDAAVEAELSARRADALERIEADTAIAREAADEAIAQLQGQLTQLWSDVEALGGYLASERARVLSTLQDSVTRFGELLAPTPAPEVARPEPVATVEDVDQDESTQEKWAHSESEPQFETGQLESAHDAPASGDIVAEDDRDAIAAVGADPHDDDGAGFDDASHEAAETDDAWTDEHGASLIDHQGGRDAYGWGVVPGPWATEHETESAPHDGPGETAEHEDAPWDHAEAFAAAHEDAPWDHAEASAAAHEDAGWGRTEEFATVDAGHEGTPWDGDGQEAHDTWGGGDHGAWGDARLPAAVWGTAPVAPPAWEQAAPPDAGWADAAAQPDNAGWGRGWGEHQEEPEPAWGQPIESGYRPGWSPGAEAEPAWEWPGRTDVPAEPEPATAWFGADTAAHPEEPAWSADAWGRSHVLPSGAEQRDWGAPLPSEAPDEGSWPAHTPTTWAGWAETEPAAAADGPRDPWAGIEPVDTWSTTAADPEQGDDPPPSRLMFTLGDDARTGGSASGRADTEPAPKQRKTLLGRLKG